MPRFCDSWVVDRTLFEYVNGGQCACCGFSHFLPGGTAGLINAISDLETDAANAEVSALDNSPWPLEMRNQVWSDRLKLRHLMKKEMTSNYSNFWNEHADEFVDWCRHRVTAKQWKVWLQMPRTEVTERVKTQYNIHSALAVVLCTVVEQVAHFPLTQLPTDGRGETEIAFEKLLTFDKRGGFTLPMIQTDGSVNTDVLEVWLKRMESLGGPKLLERAPKKQQRNQNSSDDESSGDENDDDDVDGPTKAGSQTPAPPGPSFQPDRRIIRLLISRYWADQLQKKFLDFTKTQQETKQESQQQPEKGIDAATGEPTA